MDKKYIFCIKMHYIVINCIFMVYNVDLCGILSNYVFKCRFIWYIV